MNANLQVNDIHSQLNATRVGNIIAPDSLAALRQAVLAVAQADGHLSIAGGRHAMGGQQFLTGETLLDTRRLNRILSLDPQRGLLRVEAGITWAELIPALITLQQDAHADAPNRWSIIQKQTGADNLSIGGALASNGHGRGLTYRPIVQDVESFDLIDAQGELRHCSRSENPDLFRLAIGGYGLFGVIYAATLRLMPAHRLRRVVEITDIDSLPARFRQRIADGYTYGDFQYMTDESSPGFLREGVMSCYIPLPDGDTAHVEPPRYLLSERNWRDLLHLSHADKPRAYREYAAFYAASDGQIYDSDTFQLSLYIDGYHSELDRRLYGGATGSETITELYVPLDALPGFMDAAARELRARRANVIYGTIRLIERDHETYLNWARRPYACIVFNLHIDHAPDAIARAAAALRCLIDLAADRSGSYFLTYNRYATPAQLTRCYPQFPAFLSLKRRHDPANLFTSDWHKAYAAAV